jgi:hypothetical protein
VVRRKPATVVTEEKVTITYYDDEATKPEEVRTSWAAVRAFVKPEAFDAYTRYKARDAVPLTTEEAKELTASVKALTQWTYAELKGFQEAMALVEITDPASPPERDADEGSLRRRDGAGHVVDAVHRRALSVSDRSVASNGHVRRRRSRTASER